MANPYKDAPQVKLADYIPADKFRTILPECRHIGGGISEIAAEIQVSEKFARKLSFYVSWDGLLYGFVRRKRELEANVMGGKKIKTVFIQDWDDKFLILFEGEEKDEEKAFFTSPEDVYYLLENCTRVPEQESRYKK